MAASRAVFAALVLLFGLSACRLSYQGGATTVSASELGTDWLRAAPTPVVRQQQRTDCGLAALAMIAGTWGRSWSVTALAREVKPTEQGVKLGALRDLARARGLEAYAIQGRVEDLEHELGKGRPVLLGLVLPFEQEKTLHHFEVAIAIHPRDGTVITLDPATGKTMKRSKQVLELEWKHAGYATLVVIGVRRTSGLATAQAAGAS
jgi:ABC-type bacteriocin/lantibiotic exporter with double-glycine peptidase domain